MSASARFWNLELGISLELGTWNLELPDMPTFTYKALGADGKIAEGQIEAGGRADAFRQIESQSLRPISLKEGINGKAKSLASKPPTTTANTSESSTAAAT